MKYFKMLLVLALAFTLLSGCGGKSNENNKIIGSWADKDKKFFVEISKENDYFICVLGDKFDKDSATYRGNWDSDNIKLIFSEVKDGDTWKSSKKNIEFSYDKDTGELIKYYRTISTPERYTRQ